MRTMRTIVVGSGAAGFNAADWLHQLGQENVLLLTKGVNKGTSRNTGSDKQTYYKLSLAGGDGDSVLEMAHTLFDGGSVNGDTALCEAACSVKSFMKLANLGMPFPTNDYGEYVGYKTDHDPRQRATSCGPLTSKLMTETLEKSVRARGITICDQMQVVQLLVQDNQVYGVVALDFEHHAYQTYYCDQVILATGAPSTVYQQSVYPHSQSGALGVAIQAGARLANLNHWQYGLASTKFRWNLSGSYQQVLPRYLSVDATGQQREFLLDHYDTPEQALDIVFLKGYQWPFDYQKRDDSSNIDILVHREIQQGNRVFLDFSANPTGLCFDRLSDETHDYLAHSGALFGTPIQRLEKMNPKAIALYRDHGIDLKHDLLEIAVCAQHMNGGIAVDANWQSSVKGLYAIGETAGTFGISRPGGSALNSTQVGAMRASEHIAIDCHASTDDRPLDSRVPVTDVTLCAVSNLSEIRRDVQRQMSGCAVFLRSASEMKALKIKLEALLEGYQSTVKISSFAELSMYHQFQDDLSASVAMLDSMIYSAEQCGSVGSAFVVDCPLQDCRAGEILIHDATGCHFEPVRPIPTVNNWFETVWAAYEQRRSNALDDR